MTEPARPARAMSWPNLLQEYVSTELMSVSKSYRSNSISSAERFILYMSSRAMDSKTFSGYGLWLKDKGLKPNTIQTEIVRVKKFFTWCFKMGYTSERWYEYFPKVYGKPVGDPSIIGHDEYLLIKRMCGDNKNKEFMVTLGYSTGLRMGDCCNLRWSNIDQDRQVISVLIRKTSRKTGARSNIPYVTGGDLHMILVEMWNEKDEQPDVGVDYVCPAMAIAYSVNRSAITELMNGLFRRAGIIGKSFKDFRSTFESRMANSGMNIGLAAKLTGRSDTKTLLRYIKPDMDAARDGIAKALDLHLTYSAFK